MEFNDAEQVILGAGGAISRALTAELVRNNVQPVLVSRRGTEHPGGRAVVADLLEYESILPVVPEGGIVYLTAGLPYDHRVWEDEWPRIMSNAIRVCSEKQALLVFLDNVYMYGPVDGPMTEDTPHNPTSRKGRVRAQIAQQLIEAWETGLLRGVIARSADFYGPGADRNSVFNVLVIQRLVQGKKPQWLANADRLHSFSYTTDCGRALPLLVADPQSWNRVWHLPTAHPPLTGRGLIEIAAGIVDVPPRCAVLPATMTRLAGVVSRTMRELPEMMYQQTRDYAFDSSRFESHFDFTPTSYEQGIRETINYFRRLVPDPRT